MGKSIAITLSRIDGRGGGGEEPPHVQCVPTTISLDMLRWMIMKNITQTQEKYTTYRRTNGALNTRKRERKKRNERGREEEMIK